MEHWHLNKLDVESRRPQVLQSRGEGRAIVLQLPAGEALREHQVHERAWVLVVSGDVEIDIDGEGHPCEPGTLAVFDPAERHEVRAVTDARVLLVLAPWPGVGHPGSAG